jgi:flagellar biosynthesis protein FliR
VEPAFAAIGAALLLAWVRAVAVLLVAPILGGRPLPWPVALLLSGALASAFAAAPPWAAEPPTTELVLLAAREAGIGLSIGLCARIAFSIFESAGGLVGAAAGLERRAFTSLFTAVGAGAFLVAGGHHALVSAIAGSFRACPIGAPAGEAPSIDGAIALFSSTFAGAVMVAAPAFAAALVAESVAGIAARVSPLAGFEANAPALRAACVQIAALAVLAAAVRIGVDLIGTGLARAAGVS